MQLLRVSGSSDELIMTSCICQGFASGTNWMLDDCPESPITVHPDFGKETFSH